ncbi:MAG: hypothetical protein ACK4N5_06125 [Myxococcales bacterium]
MSEAAASPPAPPAHPLRALAWRLRAPLGIALLAFVVLAAFSGHRFLRQSKAPHFVWQAGAFLEGRLDLPVDPPNMEDWVRIGDRFYQSFPAMPAVVMAPFVALWGYQFNDTSFTVIIAALSLALFYLVLRRLSETGDSPRSAGENVVLTLLLGFGTLFFYMSIRGEVWFTAQIMGVGFTSLYLLAAHRARRPLLAGVLFAMATLTRTPLMFAGIFFVAEVLSPEGSLHPHELKRELGPKVKKLLLFGLGALPLAAAHAAFNYARFGKLSEFGHRLLWNNRVNADIARWGLFDPHYLPRNLKAAFFSLPTVQTEPLRIGYDPHGLSLFITTPLLLLLLFPKHTGRLHRILWLTVACTALPGLFYQNTGYMQFGFRFSLDYTPYLVLLLAIGGWSIRSRLFQALAVIGVAVNTWGALVFRGYSW